MDAKRLRREIQQAILFSALRPLWSAPARIFLPKDCIAMEHSSFVASLIKGTPLHSHSCAQQRTTNQQSLGQCGFFTHDGNASGSSQYGNCFGIGCRDERQRTRSHWHFLCSIRRRLFSTPQQWPSPPHKSFRWCAWLKVALIPRLELPNHGASGPYIGADPAFYPRIPVDGGDVVGVFRVAQEAIRRAREGHGPAVIECLTHAQHSREEW